MTFLFTFAKTPMTSLANAEFTQVRARLNAYLHQELSPFEKNNGIGHEDHLPKDPVRALWKRHGDGAVCQ